MSPGHDGTFVPDDETGAALVGKVPPVHIDVWDRTKHNGAQLQMNILSIKVPVIGAINGPALTHADLAVQSDIVICTDTPCSPIRRTSKPACLCRATGSA